MRLDYGTSRFKRSMKRLSSDQREAVKEALKLFLTDHTDLRLDFKLRKNSKYHSIRAGKRSDNLRIAMRGTIERDLFVVEFVGNHDDLDSLDRQGR